MGAESRVEHEFIDVHGVSTYVTRCNSEHSRCTILVIPGNPGVATYYDAFVASVHRQCANVNVWCVSHAGHVISPHGDNSGHSEDFSSLDGQIRHKQFFIEEHIPSDTDLILVGHSIGCYMILRLLDQLPPGRVSKSMLLFPALEQLALTPKGKFLHPVVTYLRWLTPVIAFPLRFVPTGIKEAIVNWYFRGRAVPPCIVDGTLQLLEAGVLGSSLRLVQSEFAALRDADYNAIGKHVDRLTFYYGVDDHWCPRRFYDDMKSAFPRADIRLCRSAFQHAFVIEESEQLAHITSRWVVDRDVVVAT